MRTRLQPGSIIERRELTDVTGRPIAVPDPGHLVHLQFRRFAGCPVCNLHLRSFVRRHDEIEATGIREVVVFHSPADELRHHAEDLPFAVIADPGKRLYAEFGVESAPRALLDPRVWPTIVRGVTRSAWQIVRHREHPPAGRPAGGRFGLPGDFLIDANGQVITAKYGEHAADQWTVDQVLALATTTRAPQGLVEDGQAT